MTAKQIRSFWRKKVNPTDGGWTRCLGTIQFAIQESGSERVVQAMERYRLEQDRLDTPHEYRKWAHTFFSRHQDGGYLEYLGDDWEPPPVKEVTTPSPAAPPLPPEDIIDPEKAKKLLADAAERMRMEP